MSRFAARAARSERRADIIELLKRGASIAECCDLTGEEKGFVWCTRMRWQAKQKQKQAKKVRECV